MLALSIFSSIIIFSEGLNSPQKTRYLARENYKLVPYFANNYVKKYYLRNDEKEELIQYGYQGFMKACQKYNKEKGYKISTYSSFWIRAYMNKYIKQRYKNKNYICFEEYLVNKIEYKEKKYIINEYNLDSHEKNLLIRKYFKNETFKSIALDLKISTNTLRKKYNKIFEKIRYQESKEN